MSGNMYEWVGYTWNPLAGQCPHDCEYCYVKSLVKRYPSLREKYTGEIRLDKKALNQKLPANRIIFVSSMNDLFAEAVPDEYIHKILEKTRESSWSSRFLFQTKNPKRLMDFIGEFPDGSIFVTTIETNKNIVTTKAPEPRYRAMYFELFKEAMMEKNLSHLYEVTIEPILSFDLDIMLNWMRQIHPDFINIGADSKKNGLVEPREEKVVKLVNQLRAEGFTVHLKKNLKETAPRFFKEASE